MKEFFKKLFTRHTINIHIDTLVKEVTILDSNSEKAAEALKEKLTEKLQQLVHSVKID